MVSFCEEVVSEIKSASSEIEIRGILTRSLGNYQVTRGALNNSAVILNLIVSMRAAHVEVVDDYRTSSALLTAIAVLRDYQKTKMDFGF